MKVGSDKTQYLDTCKSVYTKGYALNWVLTIIKSCKQTEMYI